MEIKPVVRYIFERLIFYLFISLAVYLGSYLLIVLPFKSGMSAEDIKFLSYFPIGLGVIIFLLSLLVQISNVFHTLREKIKMQNETISLTTGAISLDITNIPMSQIEYANTKTDLFDSIFNTASITIGSDSTSVTINGFDKKEAQVFAEKVSASQKLRVKQN